MDFQFYTYPYVLLRPEATLSKSLQLFILFSLLWIMEESLKHEPETEAEVLLRVLFWTYQLDDKIHIFL